MFFSFLFLHLLDVYLQQGLQPKQLSVSPVTMVAECHDWSLPPGKLKLRGMDQLLSGLDHRDHATDH